MSNYHTNVTITATKGTADAVLVDAKVTLTLFGSDQRIVDFAITGIKVDGITGCHPRVYLPEGVTFPVDITESIRDAIVQEMTQHIAWNIPGDAVIQEARERVKSLIDFLASHGQSLGFDDDSDTLFIAPKGLQWDNQDKGGDDLVPVTGEELEYRSEHCDLCSGKICFCRPNDGSEYFEQNGLRKLK